MSRQSIGLLEFQHELVDRHLGLKNALVARILWIAETVAAADKLEGSRLDLAPERTLLDPVQGLADRGAGAGLRRMVGDDQEPAGLERAEQLLVHRSAVDRHVGG